MRPARLHSRTLELRETCGRQFYEQYKGEFVGVPCPACEEVGEPAFRKYGFEHRECSSCRTIWCSPRPPDTLLTVYYSDWAAPKLWTKLLVSTGTERASLQYEPRAEHAVGILAETVARGAAVAIDIGAGSGAFAIALRDTGFFASVEAIDLSEECVEACRTAGLSAKQATVGDLESGSADLLSMNDLVEHLFSPREFLSDCFRVLRPGGVLTIACPNGEGFDFKLLGSETGNITPPEHLNYFNPESLGLLLRRSGFEVVSAETPGILDVQIVQREVASGRLDLTDSNPYLHFLLTEAGDEVAGNFQRFLAANRLSSHMLVVGRRPIE